MYKRTTRDEDISRCQDTEYRGSERRSTEYTRLHRGKTSEPSMPHSIPFRSSSVTLLRSIRNYRKIPYVLCTDYRLIEFRVYLRYLSFLDLQIPLFSPLLSFLLLQIHSLRAIAMATKIVMRHPIKRFSDKLCLIPNTTSRRTLTSSYRPTAVKPSCAQIKPSFFTLKPQQSFQRSYADISPPPRPRRRAGFLRWTWRVIYTSAIGGVAYLGYVIYDLRTPPEQFAPDPNKKTLVILGT